MANSSNNGIMMLSNWNLGGISESRILGESNNSMFKMVGTDIHKKIGLLSCNRRMKTVSGAEIDGFIKRSFACTDGYVYFFSSTSGKIWQMDNTGAITLVYTAVSVVGDSKILGACEFDGFIYFTTQNYIYRIQLDYTALDWDTYVEEYGKLNIDYGMGGDTKHLGGDDYYTSLKTAVVEDRAITFDYTTDKVNLTSHGLSNGDRAVFETDGVLPAGLTSDTAYYVIGAGTHDFQITLTPITTATTVTFTTATDLVNLNAHGLSAGDKVVFATSGALPTGLTAGVTYYVINPTTNAFQVSTVLNGTAIDLGGSPSGTNTVNGVAIGFSDNGTGTHQLVGNNVYFTPQNRSSIGVAVNLKALPSTSLTVVFHDENDNAVATKTVLNANLAVGINELYWASELVYRKGKEYHCHIYQTGTGGQSYSALSQVGNQMYLEGYGTSDDEYHPMFELNSVLYIGDRNYVHQIENELVLNALDLPRQYRITSMGQVGNDLQVNTMSSDNVHSARIFEWNTWSNSWTVDDTIPESIIHTNIPVDNFVYIIAGKLLNVYYYSGNVLQLFRRIGGELDPEVDNVVVYPDATTSFHGIPLIGVSNIAGTNMESGIYAFGTANPRLFPRVFDLEYVLSQGLLGVEIGSLCVSGEKVIASWRKGATYGIDTFDLTNLYSGSYIQTRVLYAETNGRNMKTVYRQAVISYQSIQDDTPETVTLNATTNKVLLTAHGYQDGEAIVFAGNLPAQLVAGTTYYVVNGTTNDFQVASAVGGSAIDFVAPPTGTITVQQKYLVRAYIKRDYDNDDEPTEWTELTLVHDPANKQFVTQDWGDELFCLELKVELRAKGDESPVIDSITLYDQGYGL